MLSMKLKAVFFLCAVGTAFGGVIDFEAQCPSGVQASGPCSSLFATVGNAQSLTISTAIGDVVFTGGALLDHASNEPADETAAYATAGNGASLFGLTTGTGFTNPITITFPVPITNFFLDVLNGNIQSVNYNVADNVGNNANFLLVPNLSSGIKTIGFAAAGTVVTIAATTGQSTPQGIFWDFTIDNIHFDESLPASLGGVPEPGSILLMGAGLAGLAVLKRSRKA